MSKIKNFFRNPELIFSFINGNIDNLFFRLGMEKSFRPMFLDITLTPHCNSRCKMCDIGEGNKDSEYYKTICAGGKEMPLEEFKKIIDQCRRFKPVVNLSTVEPLMYKNIIDAVRYVSDAGMYCHLNTNGLLLKRYARDLCDAGLSELMVSIDAPEKLHDRIRGVPNMFKRSVEGLREIIKQKNRPIIKVNTTVFDMNVESIVSTIKYFKKLGVDRHMVCLPNFVTEEVEVRHNRVCKEIPIRGSCLDQATLNKVDVNLLYRQLQRAASFKHVTFAPTLMSKEDYYIYFKKPQIFLKGKTTCLFPWNLLYIQCDGVAAIAHRCVHYKLGSVFKNGVISIWNGKRMRTFRRMLLKRKIFPACSRCCGTVYK